MDDCSTFNFFFILFSLQALFHSIFIAFSLKVKSGDLGNRMLCMHFNACPLKMGAFTKGMSPLSVSLNSRNLMSGLMKIIRHSFSSNQYFSFINSDRIYIPERKRLCKNLSAFFVCLGNFSCISSIIS